MQESSSSFFDRTLRTMQRAWRRTAGLKTEVRPNLGIPELDQLREQIDACLDGRGGEVSARARAAELGQTYLTLSDKGRRRFLQVLAKDYDVDGDEVDKAIEARRESASAEEKAAADEILRNALQSRRTHLLSKFTDLDLGVKFLVDMRGETRRLMREHPELKALDQDLLRMLSAWFDVGFLELRRITWDTSAALLEKLIAYESVHAIQSWQDLKHRLADDRRCFAFFHPNMPDEPLIFVEVALVNGIADDVLILLDENLPEQDPATADTAIFYSISNCQPGLAGVSFGNFLIKRVVGALSETLPNLKTFATLSPIPGFNRWLVGASEKDAEGLFGDDAQWLAEQFDATNPADALVRLINAPETWMSGLQQDSGNVTALVSRSQQETEERMSKLLRRLCATYLTNEKRGARALDPVAHFHLSNGARVEQINWGGDRSANGLGQSTGMMVNYLYKLRDIEKNHEAYSTSGRVTTSAAVKKLARG